MGHPSGSSGHGRPARVRVHHWQLLLGSCSTSAEVPMLRNLAPALALALGFILVSAPFTGIVSAVPANMKIGVIDLEKTLYDTPAGKRASEAFDKTRKAKQAELDKRQKDLQKAA